MNVKQLFRKYMTERKNAKLSPEIHLQLRIFAATNGLQISAVLDAACAVGLKHPNQVLRLAAVRTSLEESTVQAG